jgi:catechol 2,3-dioxygenase-like lactoylglutathione lyase family enzyme
MKLGYTIIYVPQVEESLAFFEAAFGFSRRFLHESGDYGELETGETTLAFASYELGSMNFPGGIVGASESSKPLGFEVALVTADVTDSHTKALSKGATEIVIVQTPTGVRGREAVRRGSRRWRVPDSARGRGRAGDKCR